MNGHNEPREYIVLRKYIVRYAECNRSHALFHGLENHQSDQFRRTNGENLFRFENRRRIHIEIIFTLI